jgi:acetyl esterase/lipase
MGTALVHPFCSVMAGDSGGSSRETAGGRSRPGCRRRFACGLHAAIRGAVLVCCAGLAAETVQAQAAVTPNVEYAVVAGKPLRLDVHRPAGKGPFPAIVLVHGGGFTGGSKGAGYTAQLARHLAGHGYAAFDIDYRLKGDLGPGATLEQAMAAAREDLARAVTHVVDRAAAYGVDAERIAVGGGSAGAITALLATYGRDRGSIRPRAVVGLWGGMYGQEASIRKGDPPLLLVHGSADRTVPFAQSEAIAAAARQAGVEAVLVKIENGGHTLPLDQPFAGRTILESVCEFLDTKLR